MKRRKNDEGWMFLGFLAGPLGVLCIVAAVLMIAVAVMI
jgi:hypothetical protein